jgi:hypothetical protein
VATDQLGVYHAEPVYPPGVTPPGATLPGSTASPSQIPAPSPGGSLSPRAAESVAPEASAPVVGGGGPPGVIDFAVDLFDAEESNIAPGDGSRISAVGTASAGDGEPGIARDEWWVPLALLALLLLLAEWLVYERDGARRLRNALRERLRRPALALPRRRSS